MRGSFRILVLIALLVAFAVLHVSAQTTEFTFQGNLQNGGSAASGNHDFEFLLYDALSGGTQLGSTLTRNAVPVSSGVFSINLDFGAQFTGGPRFIEIRVRQSGAPGFTPLLPRQPVSNAPYSIYSFNATNAASLNGVPATGFIQNGGAQQTGGFNLNGTGTANILNAATQFNLGGNRVLSAGGTENIFAGFQAGEAITTGASNSFFGVLAGNLNSTGNSNSFFGRTTGRNNTTGNANSFFGNSAGVNNSSGGSNSFFGTDAGFVNTTGSNNTIIGSGATVGSGNLTNASALGYRAFVSQSNSLVLGSINGVNGGSADTNVGIGIIAPTQRLHVVGNGVFSGNLGVGTVSPTFKLELIDSSNTGLRVQTNTAGGTVASFGGLGAFRVDTAGTPGGRFSILENGNTGFGTNAPNARLSVLGGGFGANLFVSDSNTVATTFDLGNTSTGGRTWRFQSNGSGDANRVGNLELWNVGGPFSFAVAPNGNVGFGTFVPQSRVHVAGGMTVNGPLNYFDTSGNANFFMKSAGAANGINFGVVGNAGTNSTLYISQYDGTAYQDRLIIDPTGGVTINGPANPQMALTVNGALKFGFSAFGGAQTICINTSTGNPILSSCVSSIRYKKNVNNFTRGLELVRRLRPVSFDWIDSGKQDLGVIAEEVAAAEPLLATYEENGRVQGVKYDRVGVVLVNAVNEQQTQIEAQQKQIDGQAELIKTQQETLARQQSDIAALKAIVCSSNQSAEICRRK